MNQRSCSVGDCQEPHRAKGYCVDHYGKWYLYGDPLAIRPKNGRYKQSCRIEDCQRPVSFTKVRLCAMHKWRIDHHGDPHYDAKITRRRGESATCSRCGETKPCDLFCRSSNGVNQIGTVCKACKAAYDAEYRKAHREQRREANRRRRAVIHGNDAEVIDIKALWAKTDGICEICSRRVDPDLLYPDPMSPSLDHIQQIQHQGPHTLENTRLTHLTCNISRKRKE